MLPISQSVGLFVLAGLCEIGGGYLVWRWGRNGAHWVIGLFGAVTLILYGIVPTYQPGTSDASTRPTGGGSLCWQFCGAGESIA